MQSNNKTFSFNKTKSNNYTDTTVLKYQMNWGKQQLTHSVSDAASPVETGGNVPGAEDAADSQADAQTHT